MRFPFHALLSRVRKGPDAGKARKTKPISGLVPDNLYAYLDALYKKRNLSGTILEVGCHAGATAAIAYTFLARQGINKKYVCIDTFEGFVFDHLIEDQKLGLKEYHFPMFARNGREEVLQSLAAWGISQLDLVQGDICSMDDTLIPQGISVCLLDVDLKIPTYYGLRRVFPRLQEGGVLLVDDCTEGTSWVGAIEGYRQFVGENGLPERYFMGFGVVQKNPEIEPLSWTTTDSPAKESHYFFRSANPIKLE